MLLDNRTHHYRPAGVDKVWGYCLLRCSMCGLAFMDPTPDWDVMQTFYGDEYGPYNASVAAPEHEATSLKYRLARYRYSLYESRGWRAFAKAAVAGTAEVVSGRTITYSLGIPLQLGRGARIFELGYGSGNWLLAMARLGYHDLWGYDVDANPGNEERLRAAGVTTFNGVFLDMDLPEDAFDCIRLEHVFEHLLNPVQVLSHCRRMLRRGGYLVLNLPCGRSWSETISLEDHPSLELPRHLYRHTPTSARLMLEQAGYSVRGLRMYAVTNHLMRVVDAERRRHHRRPIPAQVFTVCAPAYALASRLSGRGEHMTIVATTRKGFVL